VGRNVGDTTVGDNSGVGLVPKPDRKLVLVVVLSDGAIREYDMPQDGTVDVGRSSSAEVFIDDPSVSRHHAEIAIGPGGPILRDLGSRNGTFINDQRVGGSFVGVLTGDTIRFGSTTALFHNAPALDSIAAARRVPVVEFDQKLADEGERCVRFERSMSLMIIELPTGRESSTDAVRSLVSSELRSIDVFTVRAPRRVDVLLTECAPDEAKACADRIDAALRRMQIEARLGVAAFPSDAASIDRLPVIAGMVMRASGHDGVAAAADGARILSLGDRDIIVADPAMVRLFGLVQRASSLSVPVLVVGESGVGKRVVAEALHALGTRRGRSFVSASCAAIQGDFSELLRHASGGTLLLQEIERLAEAAQAQLVDAIERRIPDIRVVATTTGDIDDAAEQGIVRNDLLLLLKGLVLDVPPLRERPKEIRLLAERFAAELGADLSSPFTIAPTAFAALRRHSWPGNIRELRTVIGNAVIGCRGTQIELENLLPELTGVASEPEALPLDAMVREYERARIEEALAACAGNQTQAAKLLRIPRRTLVSKMRAHGIESNAAKRSKRRTQ